MSYGESTDNDVWSQPLSLRGVSGRLSVLASVAQLVEQWTFNPWVVSSSLTVPPAPKQGIGIFGGIILAAVVALVIMVSMGMFLPL